MNILDVLKEEHAAILAAFESLERAIEDGSEPVRGLAYESLSLEMLLHNEIEQEIFYNHLEGDEELAEAVGLGTEEHEGCAELIDELDDDALDDVDWSAKLVELREAMTRHIADEEDRIHALAESQLDEHTLVELGNEYLQFKVSMKEQMLAGIEKERAVATDQGGASGSLRAGATAGGRAPREARSAEADEADEAEDASDDLRH